jgi:hypothetical protein
MNSAYYPIAFYNNQVWAIIHKNNDLYYLVPWEDRFDFELKEIEPLKINPKDIQHIVNPY